MQGQRAPIHQKATPKSGQSREEDDTEEQRSQNEQLNKERQIGARRAHLTRKTDEPDTAESLQAENATKHMNSKVWQTLIIQMGLH